MTEIQKRVRTFNFIYLHMFTQELLQESHVNIPEHLSLSYAYERQMTPT